MKSLLSNPPTSTVAHVRLLAGANLPNKQTEETTTSTNNTTTTTTTTHYHPSPHHSKFRPLEELCAEVERGLRVGFAPELCEEGVNGTYFLSDAAGEIIAVFKPQDEEGDSIGNPKRTPNHSQPTPIVLTHQHLQHPNHNNNNTHHYHGHYRHNSSSVHPNKTHSNHQLSDCCHSPSSPSLPDRDLPPHEDGSNSSSSHTTPTPSPLAPRLASDRMKELQHQMIHGVYPGEGAAREVAAYLLDQRHGHFSGVPPTALVEITYSGFSSGTPVLQSPAMRGKGQPCELVRKKIGSLQQFVENDGSCEDCGFTAFSALQVHKIALLDILLVNTDRHDGNLLFHKVAHHSSNPPPHSSASSAASQHSERILIPIDHGFSLPHTLDCAWFGWLTWPQAKLPLDGATRAQILEWKVEEDIQVLREQLHLRISEDALFHMRLCGTLLQRAISQGLTLYDVGVLICRVAGLHEPSELELLCQRAHNEYHSGATHANNITIKNNNPIMYAGYPLPAGKDVPSEAYYLKVMQLIDQKLQEVVQKKQRSAAVAPASPRDRRPLLKVLTAHHDTSFLTVNPSTTITTSPSSPLRPRRNSSRSLLSINV